MRARSIKKTVEHLVNVYGLSELAEHVPAHKVTLWRLKTGRSKRSTLAVAANLLALEDIVFDGSAGLSPRKTKHLSRSGGKQAGRAARA